MPAHAFVDESKKRGLVLVAAIVETREQQGCRKALRGLLLANQRRLHFTKERASRQREICTVIDDLPFEAWVFTSRSKATDRRARRESMERLAHELLTAGVDRLVLEQDESLARSDREVLFRVVRERDAADRFSSMYIANPTKSPCSGSRTRSRGAGRMEGPLELRSRRE